MTGGIKVAVFGLVEIYNFLFLKIVIKTEHIALGENLGCMKLTLQ
jgi:hypothetical protein